MASTLQKCQGCEGQRKTKESAQIKGGETDIWKKKKKTNMRVNTTCNSELDAGPGHQWGN